MSLRGLAATWVTILLLPGAASAATGPALTVDAGAGRHAISPYVYGWNFAPSPLAGQIDLPVDRRGGNSADTLNWQTGAQNTSNDFFFEITPWCWSDTYMYCGSDGDHAHAFHAYTDQIDADRTVGAKSLLDVPLMDWVAADPPQYQQPLPCSFPRATFPTQDSFGDQYDPDCGNGQSGKAWVTNDPQTGDAVPNSPAFEGGWVDDLVNRYGTAANGGVAFYELGNEPALWSDTHHDWHPQPTTYDELRDKSLAMAAAIKAHDPTAQVLAFSEWGWLNYYCSAADDTSNGCQASDTDRAAHGGTPLVDWLLQQFKADADANGGRRLVDYVDVHYYRQDDGKAGFAATRSLWDPSYTDESWINSKIDLLPSMHGWADQNYPGTKLALSEYDMSFGTTAEDNLAEADTLGIFGREGLDLATLWPLKSADHYADAFRLFRDYDGNRSKFGETGVSSQSADQSQLAVYGAQRSADNALTLAVINKSQSDLTSSVALSGFTPAASAQVFRWSGSGAIGRDGDQAVGAGGFTATFPARSMTMVVVPAAGTPLAAGPGPPPGTTVLPGSPRSPVPSCHVPRLKGLTLKKAKAKLKKAHCRLGRVTKKRSAKRKGRVIAQRPKAGKKLKSGGRVAVVLSRGR